MRAEVGGSLRIFAFVVPRDGARATNLLEVVTRQVEIVVLGQDRLPVVRGRRSWTRSDQPTAMGRSPAYGVVFIAVTPPLERASPEARRFRHIAQVPVKGRVVARRRGFGVPSLAETGAEFGLYGVPDAAARAPNANKAP
jgi:hypothetical protein